MKTFFIGICFFWSLPLVAQQYRLESSQVSFFSSAPIEDIKAVSSQTRSLLNLENGEIAFLLPIRSFEFDKQLMQEHFNENFMESEKYPDASFKGTLSGYEKDKKGKQRVTARGEMSIHGVRRPIAAIGSLQLKGNELYIEATFPLKVADFAIEIPQLLFYNIAEEVEVTLNATYRTDEKR